MSDAFFKDSLLSALGAVEVTVLFHHTHPEKEKESCAWQPLSFFSITV